MGSWAERTHGKVAHGGLGRARQWLVDRAYPHFFADKVGGTNGKLDRPPTPQFHCRKIKPQNLGLKKTFES